MTVIILEERELKSWQWSQISLPRDQKWTK